MHMHDSTIDWVILSPFLALCIQHLACPKQSCDEGHAELAAAGRVRHELQQQPLPTAPVKQQLRRTNGESRLSASGLHNDSTLVFIYHCGLMSAFALCCMHVQVATR